MLGISSYFRDFDAGYLRRAAACGAKIVFTSMQMPEQDYSKVKEDLACLVETCRASGLTLVPDISPVTLGLLDVPQGGYGRLAAMGFDTIRLDYGFNDFELVRVLQETFALVLNASTASDSYLDEAEAAGIDLSRITLMHNFYPHTDSGLALDSLARKNARFHERGLRVQAFVPGDVLKRFPLYEGLPTVERHRGASPYVAAVELVKRAHVDDVIIGDSRASERVLRSIADYLDGGRLTLHCHFREGFEDLWGTETRCRKDESEAVVRLLLPRRDGVEPAYVLDRLRGSIVMDNRLAARYSGEVSLVKRDLPVSPRANVIGFVDPSEAVLLDCVDADDVIALERL